MVQLCFLGWTCRKAISRSPWPPRMFPRWLSLLFGMFEFLRLPFGLRNTGNTFQMMMDQMIGNLPYCFVYINDILIFSPDLTSHVQHLQDVLGRVHGLTIGLGKCEFAISETSSWAIASPVPASTLFQSTPPPFETFLCPRINLDFSLHPMFGWRFAPSLVFRGSRLPAFILRVMG